MSTKETNKKTSNYYTKCMQYVVEKNAEEIQALIDLIAPKVSELTPLVREKFSVIEPMDSADVLYDIEKTTKLLKGYDNNLRLVVRVYDDRTIYALEKVESEIGTRIRTSQKLIISDIEPWEEYPNGALNICWIDESFMTAVLFLHSYGADALNRYTIWSCSGKNRDDRDLFVNLFDKKHFE